MTLIVYLNTDNQFNANNKEAADYWLYIIYTALAYLLLLKEAKTAENMLSILISGKITGIGILIGTQIPER